MEMIVKLTKPQKRALLHLYNYMDWTNTTPVTQKCLNKLESMKLVKVAFDPELKWIEKLSRDGRAVARQLRNG